MLVCYAWPNRLPNRDQIWTTVSVHHRKGSRVCRFLKFKVGVTLPIQSQYRFLYFLRTSRAKVSQFVTNILIINTQHLTKCMRDLRNGRGIFHTKPILISIHINNGYIKDAKFGTKNFVIKRDL